MTFEEYKDKFSKKILLKKAWIKNTFAQYYFFFTRRKSMGRCYPIFYLTEI